MTAWRHLQWAEQAKSEHLEDEAAIPSNSSFEVFDSCQSGTSSSEPLAAFGASDSYHEFPSSSSSAFAARPCGSDEEDLENEMTFSDGDRDLESDMHMSSDNASMHSDGFSGNNDSEREELEEGEIMEQFVYDTILRLVEIKGKAGFSQSIFEDLLVWGKDITSKDNVQLRSLWPSCWADVLVHLEKFGYKNPKLYWICLDDSHPNLFGLLTTKQELCPHCGQQGNIPYYYLSIIDKIKRWCSSPSMCQNMTAHWTENSHWLPVERQEGWGWAPKKRVLGWYSFAQLAYFWDPEPEWTLPVKCPVNGCVFVISAEKLLTCPVLHGDLRQVECPNCHNIFQVIPKRVKADPRNLAYDGK